MKRILYFICIVSIIVLASSCGGLVKYYDLNTTEGIRSITGGTNMTEINLDDYDFYKREYYFRDLGDSLIKGYENTRINSGNIRYEMQFFLVEKDHKDQKRVIYFSMIPPYRYGDQWIYSYPLYNNESVFNIDQINYVQFGTLNRDHEVKFIKDISVSIWKITLNDTFLGIDNVLFLDGNKFVDIDPSLKLKRKPVYTRIRNAKIFLHQKPQDSINDQNTDYLKEEQQGKHILYYNTAKNTINFQFSKPLHNDDILGRTWISFPADRVRGKLK